MARLYKRTDFEQIAVGWQKPVPEQDLDLFTTATGWSEFNTDCDNLAASTTHRVGSKSLTFDKVDGAANTAYALIYRTVSLDLAAIPLSPDAYIEAVVYLSSIADVANLVIRLGTSASHYHEWLIPDTDLVAGWNRVRVPVWESSSQTGDGWNPADVDYMAVGVQFDAQDDTLSGILWNRLAIVSGSSPSGSASPGTTGGSTSEGLSVGPIAAASTMTRPDNTAAYASGDLVANSTTAGSVVAFSFTVPAYSRIIGVRLKKSTNTTSNASFRAHLYATTAPTMANGDNGAYSPNAAEIGSCDVLTARAYVTGADGQGPPNSLGYIPVGNITTVKMLLEALAAYAPGAEEVFTAELILG